MFLPHISHHLLVCASDRANALSFDLAGIGECGDFESVSRTLEAGGSTGPLVLQALLEGGVQRPKVFL